MEVPTEIYTRYFNFMIYNLNINNDQEFARALGHVQADSRAFVYLNPKKFTRLLYAADVDYRAAAFIKQELLSRGGDCAVAKHVIDGKAATSDILIIANDSQLFRLLEKLKAMDCWGLKNFRLELEQVFNSLKFKNFWRINLNNKILELDDNTKLMGIINLNNNSFYEPSRVKLDNLIEVVSKMIDDGAEIIDLGAESTRPGAEPLSCDDELDRLIPALKELRANFKDIIISVDTYKSRAAQEALKCGADIINDISGFALDDNILNIIKEFNAPYVLSHIEGTPQTMIEHEGHSDILGELILYFNNKLSELESAGIDLNKIIIDPGLGFAKDFNDNFAVIKNLDALKSLGRPVLIGHSRKRFTRFNNINKLNNLSGTLAITALLEGRAQIVRVHDVSENYIALMTVRKVREAELWRE
ncbi:MAG: dihydropteroate synthase [Synergistaceae bacterium]|nr:dihydropteroate synthase [Synergistaceae bacterium]